jgi:hypothetical protein
VLRLYSQYLKEAGQKRKSREALLAAGELMERTSPIALAGATVTRGELEAERIQ